MNSSEKPKGDHYFPAAIIGGYGVLNAKKSGNRYAKVSVRYRDKPEFTRLAAAESIAKEKGTYRLSSPPPGLLPDAIDEVWNSYESSLPDAISAVEGRSYSDHDWAIIGLHMAAQGVRHPDFLNQARSFLDAQGALDGNSDIPHLHRIKTLEEGFALLAQSKLAFIERSPESRRFAANDKGYITLEDSETAAGRALLAIEFTNSPCGSRVRKSRTEHARPNIISGLLLLP